ncbi:MAG: TlpA family protein disulfide reductase [Muribaculum sp.]|nr:TlpA family protein disulfide reductase [Muribaculum sp.]
MKKSIMIFLLSSFCLACHAFDYFIELTSFDPLFEGGEVIMRDRGDMIMLNDATIVNGKAFLTGKIERNAYATIQVTNIGRTKAEHIFLVLEADTIYVNTENRYPVSGGTLTRKFLECNKYFEEEDYGKRIELFKKAIEEHSDDGIGEYFIQELALFGSPYDWDEMSAKLSDNVKQLDFYPEYNETMQNLKKTWIGETFEDIVGKNADGTESNLSDYVGKGKYVLLDFWASWCKPCIAGGTEYLIPLYEKYKDSSEFMIVGAAISDEISKSLEAAKKHGYKWAQIYDCGMKPMGKYSFRSIPQLILFDPEGRIVARNFNSSDAMYIIDKFLNNRILP